MRLRNILILFAALAFTIGFVVPSYGVQVQGDSELQLSGGFFHAQDSDTASITLDGSYGYFFTQALEGGIRQGLNYTFIDDADDPWTATTIPFVDYHFLFHHSFVPFVGGFGGIVWNDDDITGTIGPEGGFKFFLNDQTFIVTRYRYEWFFTELDLADDSAGDGNHVVTLGLGFVWGGPR